MQPGRTDQNSIKTELLNVFEGKWQTEGRTIEGAFGPSVEIRGNDTYEWLAGNYFLIHKVDVNIGNERVEALEVIGYDPSTRSYPIYAFDNQGNSSRYEAYVHGNQWHFNGISERATVIIDGDCIRATWDQLHNNSQWLPWMEIFLRRSSRAQS